MQIPTTREELFANDRQRDIALCGMSLSVDSAASPARTAALAAGMAGGGVAGPAAHAHEPTPTPYFILEELFGRIHVDEDSHLLDVGCGAGRVLAYAAEADLPGRFTGVELDRGLAARAGEWTKPFDNLGVVCGSALDMPLGNFTHFYLFNPFDNVVLLEFLDKLEARARRRVTLVHMSDNGENYSYMGRAGWTLQEQGEFWRYPHGAANGFTVFGCPQHYSIWHFDPDKKK